MARRHELGAGNMAGVIATVAFLLYWIAVIWFLANTVEDMSIGKAIVAGLLNLAMSYIVFAATFKILARIGVPL